MRRFTTADWWAYAGAEIFPDGSQPMIDTYGPLIIIIDYNGLHAWLEEKEEEGFTLLSEDVKYCEDIANRILRDLHQSTPKEMQNYLKNL